MWGKQVERLGAGRHLPFRKLNYDALKRALLDALAEPVQERAAALGARLRAEDGTAAACEALERWLEKH